MFPTYKHGECRPMTKEYSAWRSMKHRCLNPTNPYFADYGGRGITVCAEWLEDYLSFLAHVGRAPTKRHSIGRIKNDQGYCPGNVRWETDVEQNNNSRLNVRVEYETPSGVIEVTLAELARMTGVRRQLLGQRIARGCSVAEAVQKPSQKNSIKVACPKCGGEYTKGADGKRYCSACKEEKRRVRNRLRQQAGAHR